MKISKYITPSKYAGWIARKRRELNYLIGRRFLVERHALNQKIIFSVGSAKEYGYRAIASYTAERTTMRWIEDFVGRDDIVYDIGANVGAYTLLLGALCRKTEGKGIIYAFEPESSNFSSLNRNVIINGLGKWIMPVPLAFGDRIKLAEFFLSSNEPGSATHSIDSPVSEGIAFSPTHRQGIMAVDLDGFVNIPGVPFPNHIKIDVDGLELAIVQNGTKVLTDSRLKTVVIEISETVSQGMVEKIIADCGLSEVDRETWNSSGQIINNLIYKR